MNYFIYVVLLCVGRFGACVQRFRLFFDCFRRHKPQPEKLKNRCFYCVFGYLGLSWTAPGQLPDSSRTAPGQLPDSSRTAPGRLPDGSRTAPGRLPDGSRTAHGQLTDSSRTARRLQKIVVFLTTGGATVCLAGVLQMPLGAASGSVSGRAPVRVAEKGMGRMMVPL